MEIYIDDMLVKSLKAASNILDLRETFDVLRMYQMKLNPTKCMFGMASKNFLGFMFHYHGKEANPLKIQVLQDMKPP